MFMVMLSYGLAGLPFSLRLGQNEPLWLAALQLTCWLAYKMARSWLPQVAGLLFPGAAPRGWVVAAAPRPQRRAGAASPRSPRDARRAMPPHWT
jgi:hypothetical protein